MRIDPLSIPSPSQGVWHLGPVPLRAYALCIIAGVVVAIWLSARRWKARGGNPDDIMDIALWAVPFGLVGGRLYHVLTDWELYFGPGGRPIEALYVWHGGLGIWGAIALGALGAAIGARLKGIRLLPLADTIAPGLILAQAIGRWGNWFNQELFGAPTDRPWGLEIDPEFRPQGYADFATFHPTFLYESLWNLGVFALLLLAERRWRLGYGKVMALYVAGYTLGRGWIENLRIDPVQLADVDGLRWNVWMSIVLFTLAIGYLIWAARKRPGREREVYRTARIAADTDHGAEDAGSDDPSDAAPSRPSTD